MDEEDDERGGNAFMVWSEYRSEVEEEGGVGEENKEEETEERGDDEGGGRGERGHGGHWGRPRADIGGLAHDAVDAEAQLLLDLTFEDV